MSRRSKMSRPETVVRRKEKEAESSDDFLENY
jgi:hypothetical protein